MQKQTAPGCLADKKQLYLQLASQLTGLIRGVPHQTANLANASALLMESLDDVNWVGFYLMEEGRLVLGPFQGRPACIEIPRTGRLRYSSRKGRDSAGGKCPYFPSACRL